MDDNDYGTSVMSDDDSRELGTSSDRGSGGSAKKGGGARARIGAAGKAFNQRSTDTLRELSAQASARASDNSPEQAPRYVNVPSMKRGGVKRKAGLARLHKGERVEVPKRKKRRGKGRKSAGRF